MKNLLFAIVISISAVSIYAQTNILPTPSFVEYSEGQFVLEGNALTIKSGTFTREQLRVLETHFNTQGIQIKETDSNPVVTFFQSKVVLPEAYGIDVGDNIRISYSAAMGQFYGMVSLLQLIDHSEENVLILPKIKIEDAPQFEWRGLHMDVSRHFYTVEEVKDFIETMAMYKFNTFHWHLTDDQGWRIEIKQYPKLTEIGGYRDSTVIGHYTDTPRQYEHKKYGGFYTQEEIKEVVAFAAELHINVVPEIEMPGHSRAALAAYPELSCTGEFQNVPGLWGVFDDIYCSKEESIEFLQNVLDEVLELFPSEFIHIGGDEAPKTRWNDCSKCKNVMEQNELHDSHELQSYFIKRMDQYLTERGRKLIGWDEILEGGLSPNAAVMSWRGEAGGIEAAKQGHSVVMSPTSYCYFDYYQSSHESEPLAIGGFLPLEKVYEFNPIPADLTKEDAKFILGGQANVWTEYIPTYDQLEYMVYPRALALMQSLWCQKKPEYSEFLKVYLDFHESYLEEREVNRAASIHIPELKIERAHDGVAYSWWGLDPNEEFVLGDSYNHTLGGIFYIKNGESVQFDRGNGYHSLMLEYNGDQQITYNLHESDILGAEIEMNPAPHKKYNHNASLNLVDGILGTERWKGDQWLGFNKPNVEMIIDLDTITSIDFFTIGFLNQNGSWIYLPDSMKVSVSDDRIEWTKVKEVAIEGDEIVNRIELQLNTTGQYVKVEVIPMEKIPEGRGGAGSTPWTFIDEIQIFTK
ncbi:family 20 glycosylhydrolase [Crocinitomicaceae bacterium]|nr:family 20 glycosylhydrolase [Crocinitomicaceae bacterium]